MVHLHPWLALVAAASIAGCDRRSSDDSELGEAGDSGLHDTDTDDPDSTGTDPSFPRARECSSSPDCEAGLACIATYDPGRHIPEIGHCVAGCVEADDEVRWCTDSESCCPPLVCDGVHGLCRRAVIQ